MESKPLQKVREKAEKYDQTLQATDPRFRKSVRMIHEDGSTLFFSDAFIMIADEEWVVCFTEHHGFHVYHETDLVSYHEYDFVRTPPEAL